MSSTSTSSLKDRWGNFLFITPYLLVFIFMIALPLFWGIYLSFQKVDLFGPGKFIGWNNYIRLFDNKIFIQTVWNTCYFVLLTVPALVVIGLGLAMALNQQTRTANILRGVFFASTILSVTVVTLIWRIIFIPNDGFMAMVFVWFNDFMTMTYQWAGLHWSEVEAIPFLSSPDWALKSIGIATIWWCLGLPMILFTAALQQIPKDLYEAAQLDNASKWTTFRRITLPSITRTIILVTIIEIVMQFQLFGQALLMTNGGPNNTSRSIVMFIYDAGFRRWDIGMAAAASQILFLIILIAAVAQFMISRKKG